jgi:DNA-binding GntR family transcriptional regulator
LPPGIRQLDETGHRAALLVSRTPVREALRQLVGERPGRGPRPSRRRRRAAVAGSLTEMFEAMGELEALCAWFAAGAGCRRGNARRWKRSTTNWRAQSRLANPNALRGQTGRFHNAIYAGSQNGYIAEMTLATRVRVQPFRRAQFRNLGRLAKSHAEHDRVVVAIMRGDKAGAPAAMRAPISNLVARGVRALRGCRCTHPRVAKSPRSRRMAIIASRFDSRRARIP